MVAPLNIDHRFVGPILMKVYLQAKIINEATRSSGLTSSAQRPKHVRPTLWKGLSFESKIQNSTHFLLFKKILFYAFGFFGYSLWIYNIYLFKDCVWSSKSKFNFLLHLIWHKVKCFWVHIFTFTLYTSKSFRLKLWLIKEKEKTF